jgi:PKD repeat protein/FlaG/FlaF family flagellin (archaellin)
MRIVDERGLNSQIAVVMMLAVVVVAAGATAVFGFDVAGIVDDEPAPQVAFSFAYDEGDGVVAIEHGGGDTITPADASRLEVVVVANGATTATYEWASGSTFALGSGDRFVLNSTASEAPGNATHRPGFEAGDSVRVKWVSTDGDQSAILARYRVSTDAAPETRLQQGLRYEYYEADDAYTLLPDFATESPKRVGSVTRPNISIRDRGNDYAFRFTGYLKVPADGTYTFTTASDDGSEFFVDGTRVVDNTGLHSERSRSGTVTLDAGYHPITVTHFEHTGGESLSLSWVGPGFGSEPVPDDALSREPVVVAAMDASCFDLECSFDGSPSTDEGGTIAAYDWTFGDGASANGESVSHAFSSPGTYDVTLTIRTADGTTRSVTRSVTVETAKDPVEPGSVVQGLDYGYYEGDYPTMPSFDPDAAVLNDTTSNVDVDANPSRRGENFAYRFVGYVEVPENGTYEFWTGSDDGSYLSIDGERVVSNGGLHSYEEASGTVDLTAGKHRIVVTMYEHTGQERLSTFWSGPGFSKEPIPDDVLYRDDTGSPVLGGNATPAVGDVAMDSETPGTGTPTASRARGTGAPLALTTLKALTTSRRRPASVPP